jgi:hypothetical protein
MRLFRWLGSLLGMLRHRSYTIALVVTLGGLSPAQAEDTVLTLACNGTTTTSDDAVAKPVSMGIVIDPKAGKIDGFFRQFRAEISTNQTKWVFASIVEETGGARLSGSVDRITGDLKARILFRQWFTDYALKCGPVKERLSAQ